MSSRSTQIVGVPNLPHSWGLHRWPLDVFPNDPAAARHLVREHRAALIEAGALCRVGRQLAIIGPAYFGWLSRQRDHVAGYACNANVRRKPAAEPARAA